MSNSRRDLEFDAELEAGLERHLKGLEEPRAYEGPRISSIMRCLRRQAIEALHPEAVKPNDLRSLLRMRNGTIWHGHLQMAMDPEENPAELEVRHGPLLGHLDQDFPWLDQVTDYKVVGPDKFIRIQLSGQPDPDYAIQAMLYAFAKGRAWASNTYVNRAFEVGWRVRNSLDWKALSEKLGRDPSEIVCTLTFEIDQPSVTRMMTRAQRLANYVEAKGYPSLAEMQAEGVEKKGECDYCPVRDMCRRMAYLEGK